MPLSKTFSAVVVGVHAHIVEVEAHLAAGLPGVQLVGLPDTALNESRDRVRAAIVNSGLKWPDSRITVGLSPAWLPKRGSGLDVAIALAILSADNQLPAGSVAGVVALGELGLDGRIRAVSGALACALAIQRDLDRSRLSRRLICGAPDAAQLRQVPKLEVTAAVNLRSLVASLRGEQEPEFDAASDLIDVAVEVPQVEEAITLDLRDVKGQEPAKLALEIAAAGGHHVAFLGRAGVGKTLLAERFVGLLPDLDDDCALEVTSIHQLGGQTRSSLIRRPPWCAPHHTATRAAMVGGGRDDRPTIGMVSLAHRGVLFLDEAAEFEPSVIDALREPLESGEVSIARAGFHVVYPASFQMLLATNPCPCGNALDPERAAICRCTPNQRRKYLGRISGPLLDRIDLRVALTRPTLGELKGLRGSNESTDDVRARVVAARRRAATRFAGLPWRTTGAVPAHVLLSRWPLPADSQRALDAACTTDSVRGRDRVARVAWTVADLAGRAHPEPPDVRTALDLRATEQAWAA